MILDLSIVLLFVTYSITMGFVFRKKASRSLDEYFLAGRELKGWKAGFSMAATQYAADTPLLVTGLVATAGIFALWRLWIYAIAFLLMGFILGPAWRKAKVLTDAEFTELRYGGKGAFFLRILKAFHMGTFVNCIVLAMVLIAATRIAEPFLEWHLWLPVSWMEGLGSFLQSLNFPLSVKNLSHPEYWLYSANNLVSIALIVAVTTLYSTTGGLRSVVQTDIAQFLVAMIATFCYAWIVLDAIGGFEVLVPKLKSLYGAENTTALLAFGPREFSSATCLFLGVLAVQWFAQVNADGTGYLAQRTMACQSDRDAKLAALIFTFAQVLIRSLLWIPIALGLLLLYPAGESLFSPEVSESFQAAREATFARGIHDFLPVGIRGLMLTGMLAALMSTVDTHLNWGSSYWTNDLYKRGLMEKWLKREPGSRELVWVARFSNLGILLIAIFIMSRLSSIQTAWHLSLLVGSGLGVVLILRWLWERINFWSEITAGAASIFLSPWLLFTFPNMDEGARLLIMVALSTVAVLTVTYLTPPESKEKLAAFYNRVSPAGFWKKTASFVGDDPKASIKKLCRYAGATLLASLSLFLILTGAGSMVTGSVSLSSHWFFYLLVGLGLLLIPVWWRLGFAEEKDFTKAV